jgi:predicted alpha/beta hydrolase family esterase
MADYLIVPGLNNSGPEHWQTQWQQQLDSVARVEQQHWEKPELDTWADNVVEQIKQTQPRWIIAHSFGCLATVRALTREKVRKQERAELSSVEGLFFVAPADPDKFAVRDLLPEETLKTPAVIVGSFTDPWFGWEKLALLAKQWNVPLLSAGDAGHINVESGHGAWKEGWDLFRQFQNSLLRAA